MINIEKVKLITTGTDGRLIYLNLDNHSFCVSIEMAQRFIEGLENEVAKTERMAGKTNP